MEQSRMGPRAALQVLLPGVEVRLCHLRGNLVERGEDVVGDEHDRLGSRFGMASPGAKNLLPRDARGDAIGGEDRLDRLAAACLQDAELSDAPQLLLCRRASLARGGEEQVEAGGAGADD